MKLRITLTVTVLLMQLSCIAQLSDWYQNMEKYWYYRYRLVNDFELIGTGMGNSIPASFRLYTSPGYLNDHSTNTLKWADATQDLGHYISVLALEEHLLVRNGLNSRRTEEELYDALEAFDRLDRTAETFCEDIDNHFPNNPQSWTTPFPQIQNNGTSGSLNGFFIRDDVPFNNNPGPLNPDWNFVGINYDHFNRPGILWHNPLFPPQVNPVDWISGSAFTDRTPEPQNWPAGAPRYPQEGNMDQMVELFTGMGLCVNLLSTTLTYNNVNLRNKAMDAAARMTSWIPKSPMTPWFSEETGIDALMPLNPSNYLYKNAVTQRCVYGTPGNLQYGNALHHCEAGGAICGGVAPAIADAYRKVCANNNNQYLAKAFYMHFMADPFNPVFQIAQIAPAPANGSMMFADEMVAFAKDWHAAPAVNLCPWCPPIPGPNTSWHAIRDHSMDNTFGTPHIPLIYRLVQYGPGSGVNFCPPCHGFHSYEELLNSAPICGPYFDGAPQIGEWTGPDRLGHFHLRHGFQANADDLYNDKTEFNGVDYMMLFNLYSAVKTPRYLNFLINPYYNEGFHTQFPDAANGYVGSHTDRLELDWLEYISSKSHILSNGDVAFRAAKVIDLIPGTFEADYGSYFDAHIEDYVCHGKFNTSTPYHFATDNGVPIEYNAEHNSFAQRPADAPPIDDSEDSLADLIPKEVMLQTAKANLETVIKDIQDPDLLNFVKTMYGLNADGLWDKKNIINTDSTKIDYSNWVNIYPNPTNTSSYLTFQLFDNAKVKIRLINTLGQDFTRLVDYYQTDISESGKYNIVIHSEELTAGIYYCQVVIGNQIVSKKLTVY